MPFIDSPRSADAIYPISRYTWFRKVYPVDVVLATDVPPPVRGITEPVGFVQGQHHVSSEFAFYGKGANNASIVVNIWLIRLLGGYPKFDGREPTIYDPVSLGTLTVELSSSMPGFAGGYIDNTYLFADDVTVAWSPSAYMTYLQDLTGQSVRTYDPADNVNIATLGIPDFGMAHGFVIDLNPGTATAMNALLGLWT